MLKRRKSPLTPLFQRVEQNAKSALLASPFAKGGLRGIFFLLLLIFPLFLTADPTTPRESTPQENPKPILDAPSLRIPAAPAYQTTLQELGYQDVDDLLKQTLQAPSGVWSLAFDNGLLAAGFTDGSIRLWDMQTGELKHTLQTQNRVWSVAFGSNGLLVTGSDDGSIRLWDIQTGKLKHTLQVQSRVWSVAFDSNKQLVSVSEDGAVKLWNVQTGELKHTLQTQRDVLSAAFDNNRLLATSSQDGTIKLWDVQTDKLKYTLQTQNKDSVWSMAFDGGEQLASGSDGTVKLWNVQTGELKYTLQTSRRVRSIAFDNDGQLVAGLADGTINLWDVKTGELKHTIQAYDKQSSPIPLLFSIPIVFDDNGQLAAGSISGTVKLWDVQTGELKQTLQAPSSISSVAFDGGGLLTAGSDDGTVKLWDVKTGQFKQILQVQSHVNSVAFDGEGLLALASNSESDGNSTVGLWDVNSGQLKQSLQAKNYVDSVAFDGDGQLAIGSVDGTIKLWDANSGQLKQTLQAQRSTVSMAFDGKGLLAAGSFDTYGSVVELWDVNSGKLQHTLPAQSHVNSVAFDGKGLLAAGSAVGTVELWDVNSGHLKQTLQTRNNWVISVAFGGKGLLASVSDTDSGNSTIELWDVKSGHLKQTLQTHNDGVISVAFDGERQLVSGSDDGTVKLWEAETGVLVKVLLAGVHGAWVSLASDGAVLRADDGSLLRTGQLLDEGKQTIKVKQQEADDKGNITEKLIEQEMEYNSYHWKYPPLPDSSTATWSMKLDASRVDLLAGKDGKAAMFTLSLTNTGSQPVYEPHILPSPDADGLLQVIPNEPQPAYPQPTAIYSSTSLIPTGQTIKLAARVIPITDKPVKSGEYILPIKVEVSGGAIKQVDLSVNLKTPDVVVTDSDFNSDGNTLSIQLNNQGAADLPKTDFYLADPEAKLNLPRQSLESIPAQSAAPPLAFTLPPDMSSEQRKRLQLEIRPMQPPLYTHWRIPLEINVMPIYQQALLMLFGTGLLGITIFYFRRYRHPLVLELGASPQALLHLPLEQLPEAQQRLQQTGRLTTVLDSAEVSYDTLKQAIAFPQASAEQKAQTLAMRLGGKKETPPNLPLSGEEQEGSATSLPPSPDKGRAGEGFLYTLKLPATFPLNVDRLLLYFPTVDAQDAFTHLQAIPQAEGRITLIIGPDSAYQRKLLNTTQDLSNKYVAPQSKQITELLLSPHAETALAKIMSEQLSLKQISPYQIGGGVNKESIFFGRRELIAQIVNRDPANYLLVGGRQMGKSSLLKALERRYADNPQVQCHYHTLSNEVMVPRLARALQLPDTDDAETFAAALEQRIHDTRQRFIFLIDEADRFIEHEQAQGYPILNVFRRLSEQGHCSFILAGFWQLYQHAVLDYQSPLRNFGEVLEIGALERDACYQLATQPMQTMNLGYASDTIVQDMVQACGQRANLIAYVCHQLIQNLPPKQRTIEAGDIHQVLSSRDMGKRFEGWSVGNNEQEQRYDRLLVYATIGKESFSTGELLKQLEEQNLAFDAAELERTLSRLELAFILTRENNRWRYRVPLFVEYMRADDPEVKLATVLKQW